MSEISGEAGRCVSDDGPIVSHTIPARPGLVMIKTSSPTPGHSARGQFLIIDMCPLCPLRPLTRSVLQLARVMTGECKAIKHGGGIYISCGLTRPARVWGVTTNEPGEPGEQGEQGSRVTAGRGITILSSQLHAITDTGPGTAHSPARLNSG